MNRIRVFVAICVVGMGTWSTENRIAAQAVSPRGNVNQAWWAQLAELQSMLEAKALEKQMLRETSEESESRLAALLAQRDGLLQKQDSLGVSNASFDEILRVLQTQKVQLVVDLAGLDARREALMASRAQASEHEPDEVIEKLKELVAIQREKLQQAELLRQRGNVSAGEILSLRENMLQAEINLARASHGGGNSFGPALDQQLLELSLHRAETAARLDKVEQLLSDYVQARGPVESVSRIQTEISALHSKIGGLEDQSQGVEFDLKGIEVRKQRLESQIKAAKDGESEGDR